MAELNKNAQIYEVVIGQVSIGTITSPDEHEKWIFGYLTKYGVDGFEEFESLESCKSFVLDQIPEAVRTYVTFELQD